MRLKLNITGLVQGVGFRPFVYRLAVERGLKGYVLNNTIGVMIEVEGEKQKLDDFLIKISREKPEISEIFSLQHIFLDEVGYKDFEIRKSKIDGDVKASVLPDLAVCEECINDISNPHDRRFIYPFTNCTKCGPRFTIIRALPYDRKSTSMHNFRMCPDCEREYARSSDRRFHAQPNACPVCGPWVSLYDSGGNLIGAKDEALKKAVSFIRKGHIIAVKGIGGYHLICDATNEDAVKRLRRKKHREEKPMAVMFSDLKAIKKVTFINMLEERAITSIERPIVIVKKRQEGGLADSVSPDNSTVGVFLPYTPLHCMMLKESEKPVVATSANITDDPIVKDEADAFARLSSIADYFLTHNRDIVRRCDDSVVKIAAERQVPIRRSRGYAPLPVTIPFRFKKPVLALGPHMNNTISIGIDDKVFISQHLGDLDTPLAMDFYGETIHDFLRLFDVDPALVVSDMHPGYYSTKYGEKHFKDKLVKVQHHYSHVLSCMIENEIPEDSEVIGFAFDGTGYGADKTIWGGEVLIASYKGFKREYHVRPYKLPGGDRAIKEPYRTAFSLLYETVGGRVKDLGFIPLKEEEKMFFINMMNKNINSPVTSSMGRLFDGVASIINLIHRISYHAQAAIALEQAALRSGETGVYSFAVGKNSIDFRPLIEQILNDLKSEKTKETVARKFHNTLVDLIVSISESIKSEKGISTVALSGGVFQNSILIENAFNKLKEKGFVPIIHQLVPPNDGGISLGQAVYGQFI